MENCTKIIVRKKEERDLPWIKEILNRSWGSEIIIASKPFKASELPSIIAETEGNNIGLLTYNISDRELEIVSLDSTIQNKGAGTALIEKIKEIAIEEGLKRIYLVTSNDNLSALRFYQKRGLRIVKIYPDAIDEARKIKPNIPQTGEHGIPLKDALELEFTIKE